MLTTWSPVPIPIDEIKKGLSKIEYDHTTLSVVYTEAGNVSTFDVPIHKRTRNNIVSVKYVNKPTKQQWILYPDYYIFRLDNEKEIIIPKIGRESYDLMGKTGSPHAGELVGFGCSVFHSTLQFVQVLASMLEDHNVVHLEQTLSTIRENFFKVDPSLHHRIHLAKYQTKQIVEAVIHGRTLTYADYVFKYVPKEEIQNQETHGHTQEYLNCVQDNREPSFEKFLARLTNLQNNFTDLYPRDFTSKAQVLPRVSFYDGSNVEIKDPQNDVKLPNNLPFIGVTW
jgi:hypothetical protein